MKQRPIETHYLSLPADVCAALEIAVGDDAYFEIRQDTVILRKSTGQETEETADDNQTTIRPFITHDPGKIIDGRFEVIRHLGDGFRSTSHLCRELHTRDNLVVLKTCLPDIAKDESSRARWIREMRASRNIQHPNCLKVFDYFSDAKNLYSITEYVVGETLAELQDRRENIAIDRLRNIFIQLCAGLDAIHTAGYLHRDIKHESVFISYRDEIKILGAGSVSRTGIAANLKKVDGLVRTVDFVAPEYLEHGVVDSRGDIYAIGVIAYELLTNNAPFRGESIIQLMTKRLNTDPAPPEQYRPDCPKELSDIILRALARYPENRYQTAKEMLHDLNEVNLVHFWPKVF
ncbi:MAG: serine/threonine-protein kinase [bacterium]|nr:serine/threonine-protein kinase [bacterium]